MQYTSWLISPCITSHVISNSTHPQPLNLVSSAVLVRSPAPKLFSCNFFSQTPESLEPKKFRSTKLYSFRAKISAHSMPTVIVDSDRDEKNNSSSFSVSVFSREEILQRLEARSSLPSLSPSPFSAFFSSVFGGVTLDPSQMLLPIDDHMVHRGHGVFDTCIIRKGHLYDLESHLDRLLSSSLRAQISPPFSRTELREIIIGTAKASSVREEGHMRFWISAGTGGFHLSTEECPSSEFYAIAIDHTKFKNKGKQGEKRRTGETENGSAGNGTTERNEGGEERLRTGVRVMTSSIPMKPPLFATMKNVNYLPNALLKKEAEENGVFEGIWLDERGKVAEGPGMNVAFVTQDDWLVTPPFDKVLAGCTVRRVMDLAREKLIIDASLSSSPSLHPILSGVKFLSLSLDDALNCKEAMLVGSGVLVTPLTDWDGKKIGNGRPGPVTLALHQLLLEDMASGPLRIRL